MKGGPVLFAAMPALAAATVLAAGSAGAEKPLEKDSPIEERNGAPAGGQVVNYEELFGCKPMEDMGGHGHANEKRQAS